MVEIEVFTQQDIDLTRKFAIDNSECSRRKYGSLIKNKFNTIVLATNRRVGNYCSDQLCVRDYCKVPHGERVELGGEVHSEAAALIQFHRLLPLDYHFLLVGVDKHGKQLSGPDGYPCHACGAMIKFAGFKHVWIPFDGVLKPVSIDEILEHYEQRYD